MLQSYKNSILRVIAWLHIAAVVLLLLLWAFDYKENAIDRWVEFLIVGILLLWILKTKSRSNMASWVLSGYLLISNILFMHVYLDFEGKVQTNVLFPLPILWTFLLGRKYGTITSAILVLALFGHFAFSGWDWSIFGPTGYFFLFSLVIVTILSYSIEFIREALDKHSSAISEIDALTGLSNRSGFLIHLESAVLRAEPFYLIQMDLDNFRRINLVMGSVASDDLLAEIGKTLSSRKILHDVCRHYGDGFAWIYEKPLDTFESLMIEIQEELNSISQRMAKGMELNMSFGVARFPDNSISARELWSQAEIALRKAKEIGKKQMCVYQSSYGNHERLQIDLLEDLRRSIEQKSLQVHFQPKICMYSKRVCGVETLARWNDPKHGYVPPDVFIPLAEKHGLIYALGTFVIEKSLEALVEFREEGYNDITVAVNVSSSQLAHPGFDIELLSMCDKYNINPNSLWLEITESVLLQKDMGEILLKLTSAGFKFSLDDFGTGYSSLSYLTRFPFQELKVDKAFTDVLLRSEKDRHVFKTILQLSQGLGMATVVEGVETKEQIHLLQDFGATHIQGWFFARAMPIQDCMKYIKKFDIQTYDIER